MATDTPSLPPASVAIALRYDRASDPAPRVVATGRGHLAQAILDLAFATGVKVREDADLAGLLAAIEIGEAIPLAAFAAVAEILARLQRANEAAS
jgi:flagellar biosynthesis protein